MLAKQNLTPLEFEIGRINLKSMKFTKTKRLRAGFRVLECEKEVQSEFCGVQIKGFIDRIDAAQAATCS